MPRCSRGEGGILAIGPEATDGWGGGLIYRRQQVEALSGMTVAENAEPVEKWV
jgi:hypothetical protein